MKVIVAGFPKTGTKTMQAALKELGYNVYDYMENFEFLEKEWKQICTVGGSTELFRKMYENVDAVTDIPGCAFWDEILKAFPDAKVILTLRENEDEWFESFERQANENLSLKWKLKILLSVTGLRLYNHGRRIVLSTLSYKLDDALNKTVLKMRYRRHNAHVLQNAPKDHLLVFNVKSGWGPLCTFLGVPVPDTPFPHKNKNASIVEEMFKTDPTVLKMQRETKIAWLVIASMQFKEMYKNSRGDI
ncbi:uncharacterized protein LOC144751854 [Ciona intestinalis]